MAQQQDTIIHFSHPGHELVKRHYIGPLRCDMCWEDLSGPAYGCLAGYDFAIHESCADHPQTHYHPAHPSHSLVLLQTGHDAAHGCDVCAGCCAPGSFLYRCPPCGFDMHPTCARLPQVVRSARHPAHDLTLVVADGCCAACRGGAGRASYYRCMACKIDFHVSCAATAGDNNNYHQARHDGNAHVQQADAAQMQAVARDLEAELQRARIQAQSSMGFANTMRNAGLDLLSLSYPGSTVRRGYF